MRLVRLEVENFAAVRSAELEFGAGLNVLHGPNDLGKSTLARAIRAALLLPHNSSAHEDFVAWGTDDKPRVELVFQAGPKNTYYRVRKVFGRQGSATLESSGDGQTWTQEHKGRRVDAELRKLLRWGIPEPGGKGGSRGLPESFLSAVLMAEQGQVEAIFDSDLEADKDESGKKLLGEALQALAQDPLFKSVLARAQAHVDEAFTSTGGIKRGRDAPFTRIKNEIAEAGERVRDLQDLRRKTEELEHSIQAAIESRVKVDEEHEDAAEQLRRLETAFEQQRVHVEASARLDAAREALAREQAVLAAVAESEALLERQSKALEVAGAHVAACRAALEEREARVEAAKQAVARAESDETAKGRELERSEIENELLRVEAERNSATTRVSEAEAVGEAEARVETLAERVAALTTELREMRVRLEELAAAEQAAVASSEQLSGLRRYRQWQVASSAAEQARSALQEAESLRAEAGSVRAAVEHDEAEIDAGRLPTREQIEELEKLETELLVAEAKVSVGFSVSIVRNQPHELRVRSDDDEERTAEAAVGAQSFEAERRIELGVGDVVDIVVAGGHADARAHTEALRERWQAEAAPVLARAGVDSLADVKTAFREAEERLASLDERRERAAACDAEAERLESVGGKAGDLADRSAALRHQLDDQDLERLAELAADLPDEWESELDRRQTKAEQAARASVDERMECAHAVKACESKLADARSEHERESEALAAREKQLGVSWTDAKAAAEKVASDLTGKHAELTAGLEALASERASEVDQVEAELREAEQALADARKQLTDAEQAKEAAVRDKSKTEGELETRRANAAKVDVESGEQRVAELEAEIAALTLPGAEVTEDALARARARVAELEQEREHVAAEIKKLEGGLEQVGGEVVKERTEIAEQALRAAREHEEELELDYGAWRLLRDTLREVENSEGAHLGQALTGPVSEKFAELTGGRYKQLELDPSLAAKGVEAFGQRRELDKLSAGVQEQLATIIRLAIAAHLGSVVVLDDHLTQTDARRIDWFQGALRSSATSNQVVVLTCRPQDYVGAAEDGGDEVHVVDLQGVVERSD